MERDFVKQTTLKVAFDIQTTESSADEEKICEYTDKYPIIRNCVKLTNSDAHFLWDINESENYIEIDDEPYSGDRVRRELFRILRGK